MGKMTFGATGLSYQCDKVEVKVEGAPKCPRCSDPVYFNEEKKALGKTWHRRCFTCTKCNKRLESTNYNQNNDDVLCTACYRKTCGPRVYGFVAGAVLPTALDFEQTAGTSVERTSTSASSSSCSSPSLEPCPSHVRSASVSSGIVNRDDPQCCPCCGKRVYFAEEIKAMKRKWHRLCFKCRSCSKSLEPGRCSEHEKNIYCQSCYGRQFGPRGYGYAGGSGSLLLSEIDTSQPPTPSYRDNNVTHQRYSFDYTQPQTQFTQQNGGRTDPEMFEATEPVQPIRGTHEWTEAVFAVPSSSAIPATVAPSRPNPGYYAPPAPAFAPVGYPTNGRGYYSNEPGY